LYRGEDGIERWKCLKEDVGGDALDLECRLSNCTLVELLDELVPKDIEPRARELESYHYLDLDGTHLFDVVRFEPKKFLQRRPIEGGGYAWNLNGTKRVLYRLPKVAGAVAAGMPILVVEGERDVHAAEAAGLVATT